MQVNWQPQITLLYLCLCVSRFLDIQEFYELTLLDETKTVQQKTAETLQMASKWETTNQQTAPAVIIPTRYGDIQQQSCVTALFPMEVRFILIFMKEKLSSSGRQCTQILVFKKKKNLEEKKKGKHSKNK